MVAVSTGPWTMNVALNRKRSRLALDSDDDELPRASGRSPLRSPSPGDTLKRTKTQEELDEVGIVAPEDAWVVDVASILASPTLHAPNGGTLQAHNNLSSYSKDSSLVVLCVQGNLRLHYDLLCAMLPDLYTLSPSLQAFVLCRDPATHTPSTTAPFSLPLIQAVGGDFNHFVRLGLLHPLGGGQFPLDALVVVDPKGRRRLVLPFGWGAGRHVGEVAGGRVVQDRLMDMFRECIEALAREQ
ncbi:hypothetical protein CC78DRAFT_269650 [Lojkania enalia]|uniref:Uncharacterized protein n=1 Tax=Lojkania enalia TaxID=147567 RepID=A0A9P4N834_9PLEO|nr:hypothetical protein CC78DRAFT_269650 [Didymosphaeria enalia]